MTRAVLLALASAACVAATAAPVPDEDPAVKLGRVYGNWNSTDRNCTYRWVDDALRVSLPRGRYRYRQDPPLKGEPFSAPFIVKEVEGDFTAVVRVHGPFTKHEKVWEWMSAMAGLVADDGPESVCIWRGVGSPTALNREGIDVIHVRPQVRAGMRGKSFLGSSEEVWLRMSRQGSALTTGWSEDGKEWSDFRPITVGWTGKVKVGVLFGSVRLSPTEVTFDRYSLTQPKK